MPHPVYSSYNAWYACLTALYVTMAVNGTMKAYLRQHDVSTCLAATNVIHTSSSKNCLNSQSCWCEYFIKYTEFYFSIRVIQEIMARRVVCLIGANIPFE